MTTSAFIIVDMQIDCFLAGAMPLKGLKLATDNEAVAYARKSHLTAIVVQHVAAKPHATLIRPRTPAVVIQLAAVWKAHEYHSAKNLSKAFSPTDLLDQVQRFNVNDLVLAGLRAHVGIDTTVCAAFDWGYQVTELSDATALRSVAFGNRVTPAALVQTAVLAGLNQTVANVISVAEWSG